MLPGLAVEASSCWATRGQSLRILCGAMQSKAIACMNKVIGEAAQALKCARQCDGKVRIVMGNESADLDSMVCALLYAVHLSKMHGAPAIPLFNIPREEFELRLDAKYLFERVGIDVGNIPHLEEVETVWEKADVQLTLVDHNVLADRQKGLRDKVVQIIDHHEDEKMFNVDQVIEMVGSCTSLVLEKIQKEGKVYEEEEFLRDKGIAEIALAAILLDTGNLDRSKKKFEDVDIFWANRMSEIADLSQFQGNSLKERMDAFYDTLLKMRTDVSLLNTSQLLRKDLKFCSLGEIKLGISAIPICLEDWRKIDPQMIEALSLFANRFELSLVVVMTAFTESSTNGFSRELLVYSNEIHGAFFQKFQAKILEGNSRDSAEESSLRLEAIPIVASYPYVAAYKQHNVLASRKQVMPLVLSLLAKL